ncbi:hypothetical protein PENTCL1PPCAC_2759, partial [Pristionchus entomophagus]
GLCFPVFASFRCNFEPNLSIVLSRIVVPFQSWLPGAMSKTSSPNFMQLTCMAWTPNRPCMVMRFPNTTIMMDCALDMTSLSQFTPFMYSMSERLKRCDSYPSSNLHYIKQICGKHYVEAMPEMHPVPLCSMSMDQVDAILISNWNSLLALPFYTEGTGFCGRVYASEPTLQYGTLMMEELMEYFERVTHNKSDNEWKDPEVYADFRNPPMRSPLEWREMYSEETMKKALERIRVVAFTQPVTIDGNIKATSYCSGYAIGACNWVISKDSERFGYLSASASRSLHTRAVDWQPFKDLDTLVVTSLCTLRDNDPEKNARAMMNAVMETVKQSGSVILPINPCGLMFDLLDLLAKTLDAAMDIPIYVISPVAKRALAFANVYPEWLSDGHQERVYMPEEPFRHHRMMENRKIKVYDSIYGDFSRELRTPCVVIAGHPSLRVGDAPHLIEMWGNDPRNLVIISDSDYPPQEVYGPFEELKIRYLYYPIDCRVDFQQLNQNILPGLKPSVLVVPDAYTRGQPDVPNTCIEFNPLTPLRHEETATIPSKSRKRKIRIHPEIAAQLKPRGFSAHPERGICSLKGVLNCYDNELHLVPAPPSASTATRPAYTGRLTADTLAKSLAKAGLTVAVSKEDGKTLFSIEKWNAVISLSPDGLHTNIRAPKEHRPKLSEAISASLLAI